MLAYRAYGSNYPSLVGHNIVACGSVNYILSNLMYRSSLKQLMHRPGLKRLRFSQNPDTYVLCAISLQACLGTNRYFARIGGAYQP